MNNNSVNNEQGFTMIELLAVILILGVLTAVAIPAYMSQRAAAHETALKVNLSDVGVAVTASDDEFLDFDGVVFKEPVNLREVDEALLNPDTQIGVHLNKGVVMDFAASTDDFCVAGYHESDPENIWSYHAAQGGITKGSCLTSVAPHHPPPLSPHPT